MSDIDNPAPDTRRRSPLGRGLSALLGEDPVTPERGDGARLSPIEMLRPNRYQPRRYFDDEALAELAASIRTNGLVQPILVRRLPEGTGPQQWEIIAGERRWRAAQLARLHEVPIVIREMDDRTALEIAIVENVQRENLSAIDEAEGYRRLIDEFAYTQERLAEAVGKSRPHIANLLRLLNLPPQVREMVGDGRLSAGHARALIGTEDPVGLAEAAIREGWSVRETERRVAGPREPSSGRPFRTPRGAAPDEMKDADTAALERDLSNLLGLKVVVTFDGNGGALTINYKTLDQLDDVLRRLGRG